MVLVVEDSLNLSAGGADSRVAGWNWLETESDWLRGNGTARSSPAWGIEDSAGKSFGCMPCAGILSLLEEGIEDLTSQLTVSHETLRGEGKLKRLWAMEIVVMLRPMTVLRESSVAWVPAAGLLQLCQVPNWFHLESGTAVATPRINRERQVPGTSSRLLQRVHDVPQTMQRLEMSGRAACF